MKKEFDENRVGSGTKEWAEETMNIQVGCSNDCLYCYAASNADRRGIRAREHWSEEVLTKKARMTSYPKKDGVIMFPTTHDITEHNFKEFITAAQIILNAGNRLLVVTKPRRAIMKTVMNELAHWKDNVMLRFTIGAKHDYLYDIWEPGAPKFVERISTLADAEARGFMRSVSIEPMLGGVEETLAVVEQCMLCKPETIWIGKMNKIDNRVRMGTPEVDAAIEKIKRQQSDSEIVLLHAALKGIDCIRWKDSIKQVLEPKGLI